MHTNLKKIKSAILSGMIAAVSVASSLSTVSAPSLSAGAADSDNYAKLLQYSLYFYDANMCGDLSDCALSWRGNCHMNDDVVGGFHDAGDHVWFGVPEGYTAAVLGWSYYEFKDAYDATGQGAHLKVITDRFASFIRGATKLSGDSVSSLLIEKGEGGPDHDYWGPPEQQGSRGRMLWSNGNCANVAAEYAAALAANYVNFGNPDDLKYAKALYNFAKSSPGGYSCEFYGNGESGTADELAWAACWLAIATNKDSTYMADVNNAPEGWWVMNWENVALGASILKGELTGDWSGAHELDKMSGDGYKFYDKWGSARHNATAQMCSLVAAKHGKGDAGWAKGQMEYLTGDKAFQNGQKHCLVVGFKSDSSKSPHHRAASGITDGGNPANDGTANKNLLIGALCGGPIDASGTYSDIRSDYVGNEVACDYNAGFVGAAAGLYSFYKTGSIETSIPGVTKIYSGSASSTPTPQPATNAPQQPVQTTAPTPSVTPTTTKAVTPTPSTNDGDTVLTLSDMKSGTEEGGDGGINNYVEFSPKGAKSATLYVKINSSDTEISGEFGTWTGEWLEDKFEGVKAGSDKIATVDYTIPSNVGSTVKAIVWWPHGNDAEIQKVVLHGSSSSSNTPAATQAPVTTKPVVTTTKAVVTQPPVTQPPVTQPPVTQPPATQPQQNQVKATVYGDANLDGYVSLADALAILQYIANANKYGLNDQALANADCCGNGDGITANDALVIQQIDAGRINKNNLPVAAPIQ